MTSAHRFLIAVSALNVACAAVSVSQLPVANAAHAEISEVVRGVKVLQGARGLAVSALLRRLLLG